MDPDEQMELVRGIGESLGWLKRATIGAGRRGAGLNRGTSANPLGGCEGGQPRAQPHP